MITLSSDEDEIKVMKKKKKRILESDDEDEHKAVGAFIDDEAQCDEENSSDGESGGSIGDFIDDSHQDEATVYYNNESLTQVIVMTTEKNCKASNIII